jgi:putative nucleotidyltransferase with HDIG domain
MIQRQRELIENYAKEETDKLGLYAWPHVKRVARLCLKLAKALGLVKVNTDVLEASALLHDIAKISEDKTSGKVDHGVIGARMAEDFLMKSGFKKEFTDAVSHCILAHTHYVEPSSIEAKILHDADYVDKVGAVGVASILIKACLSDTTIEGVLEAFESKTNDQSPVAKHINQLRNPHLYTKPAKDLVEERNRMLLLYFGELKNELELRDNEPNKKS